MSVPANVFSPSPHQLRDVVIEYLLDSFYTNTAKAFARESAGFMCTKSRTKSVEKGSYSITVTSNGDEDASMDELMGNIQEDTQDEYLPKETLRLVELRKEIKLHILCGRIEDAMQMLNKHFPSVLQDPEVEDGIQVINGRFKRNARESPIIRESRPSIRFTSQCSTKPIHLVLNLQILAFIEAARSVPLPYLPSGLSQTCDPSSSRGTGKFSSSEEQQTALLHHAQRLYAKVQSLSDPRDRDAYRKEMENVVGLLAYRDPENSPMSKYMQQGRRDAVANQINSAILLRLGQPAAPRIEVLTRHTSVVFDTLRSMKHKLPPSALRPPNVVTALSALSRTSADVGTTNRIAQIKGERERENNEVPIFDLSQLVRP